VQASQNKPPLILNSTVAPNPQPYKLVVDSRLGVLVSSNSSNGAKQPKIQVCTLYCGFKFSVCLNATEACWFYFCKGTLMILLKPLLMFSLAFTQ